MSKSSLQLSRALRILRAEGPLFARLPPGSEPKLVSLNRLGIAEVPVDFLRWALAPNAVSYRGSWQVFPGAEPERWDANAIRNEEGFALELAPRQQRAVPGLKDLEQADYWQNLIRNFSQGILIVDAEGRILELSSSVPFILHMVDEQGVLISREGLIGRSISTVCGPAINEAILEYQRRVRADVNAPFQLLREIRGMSLEINAFPVLREGELAATCFLFFDVTKRTEAERQLRLAEQERAQQSNLVSLGRMAGGIAHEINTPLATISLSAEQLLELLGEEPMSHELLKAKAKKISETVERIAVVIRGLRLFSRDSSEDSFQPLVLGPLLEETLSFCRERLRKAGVELRLDPGPEGLCFLGRGVQISQVLLNLISNAADAVAELPERWVELSARREKNWIEIRVADSGPGIPEELRQKLFQPFFTTKAIGKGTGLGLSISFGIVREHGGELLVDPGRKNTCFLIRLPAQEGV